MSVTCDESESVAALDGDGNRGEDVVSEGMVGGEGEEVAGGGAEMVDEVRGLLSFPSSDEGRFELSCAASQLQLRVK